MGKTKGSDILLNALDQKNSSSVFLLLVLLYYRLTTMRAHTHTHEIHSILGILRLDLTALYWVNKDLAIGCLLALQRITLKLC